MQRFIRKPFTKAAFRSIRETESGRKRPGRRTVTVKRAGFTLIELVVVLAIVAIIVSVISPRLTLPYRLPSPALITFLEDARSESLRRMETVRIFDETDRLVAVPIDKSFALGDPAARPGDQAGRRGVHPGNHLVTFFHDGTATLSSFEIRPPSGTAERPIEVRVNPFNGRIDHQFR